MANTYSTYSADYEQGLSDGGEYNARHNPGERSGQALADYNRGFEDGQSALDQYCDDQDN